jgi:hypothetical protein
MEATTETGSMPCAIPTNRETIIKVIKGFSFNLTIRRNRIPIPKMTMNSGIKVVVYFVF